MNYFLKEIKNWFQKDEILEIEESGEDKGVINFYDQIFRMTSHDEYIDDIPTFQHFFTKNYLQQHNIDQDSVQKHQEKVIFYINLLKSKEYLEIIPRLTVIDKKIEARDHLLINKKRLPISFEEHMMQALNESVGHAKSLLNSSYGINDEFLFKMLNNKNNLYILFLPYYYLMEKLRTKIDPVSTVAQYKTTRRDKQLFLDRIYQELIKRKVLVYDNSTPDLERLNSFYRFAWMKPTLDNPGFVQHYYYIFRIFMKDFLMNNDSFFFYGKIKNTELNKIVEELDENFYKTSPDMINRIIRIFLQHYQNDLLKDSKTITEHPEYRFVRNLAVELIMQGATVKELEIEQKKKLAKSGQIAGKDNYQFYEIMVHYHTRADEVLAYQVKKLEDLKEILKNPANHEMFFSNCGTYEESIHSFKDLLKKYLKYKRHFLLIFPELGNIRKEADQLKLILNSFKRIGLLVHVVLPAEDCEEVGYDTNWYAESYFWSDPKEREKAKEHFQKEYQFSKNKYWKRIFEVWLQYLPHNVKAANTKSGSSSKKEKILI
ncbi:MAG: hypothetical protein GY754_24690 [bacterium]|nr:hypothetical protein [bacterium]